MRAWGRRTRLVSAGAAIVAVGLAIGGAQARPVRSDQAAGLGTTATGDASAARVPAAAAGRPLGVPRPGTLDQTTFNGVDEIPSDAELRGTTARATRSKITLTVPVTRVLGYVAVCLDLKIAPGVFVQTCCPGGKGTCPDEFYVDHPKTSYDDTDPGQSSAGVQWTLTRAKIWPLSPTSSRLVYGTFPSVPVQLLAFGSVPVTARVTLTQRVGRGGLVDPLRFEWLNLAGTPDATTVAGFPIAQPDGNSQFNLFMRLRGSLDVHLSDVRIDGVATDVGPNCRTATPATVDYAGPSGWYRIDKDPAELNGRPGEFAPLNTTPGQTTGQANATVTIPRFRGCRDGARSLDPLVTALASGPGNPLTVKFSKALFDCNQPTRTEPCPPYPGDANHPNPAARSVSPRLAALLERHDDDVVRVARGLDATARQSLVNVLPKSLATRVRQAVR